MCTCFEAFWCSQWSCDWNWYFQRRFGHLLTTGGSPGGLCIMVTDRFRELCSNWKRAYGDHFCMCKVLPVCLWPVSESDNISQATWMAQKEESQPSFPLASENASETSEVFPWHFIPSWPHNLRALPQAYLPNELVDLDLQSDMDVLVHSLVKTLPMSTASKSQMRVATTSDDCLVILQQLTKSGWPTDCRGVPEIVRPYWNVRDQVHEAEGLMFLWEKLILPASLRKKCELCSMKAIKG